MPEAGWISIALLVDGLVGLAGGLLPEGRLARNHRGLSAFAAAALLGTMLFDILPTAAAAGAGGVAWAVAAIGLSVGVIVARRGHRHGIAHALPVALLASDAVHNVADGAAIAAAFLVSPRAGAIAAAGVLAHELPEEIADYVALRESGMHRLAALAALAGVQLTAGVGAAGVLLACSVSPALSAVVLAGSAGMFAYVAGTLLWMAARPSALA